MLSLYLPVLYDSITSHHLISPLSKSVMIRGCSTPRSAVSMKNLFPQDYTPEAAKLPSKA